MSAEQGDVETIREALAAKSQSVLAREEQFAALDRLAAAQKRGSCVVCWTRSWAPCPEGTLNAIPSGFGGFMVCEMCRMTAALERTAWERGTLLAAMQAEPPDDEVVRYFQRLHGLPEIGLVGVERELRLRAEKAERALAEIVKFEGAVEGDESDQADALVEVSRIARSALRPSEDTSDES